MSGGCPRPAMAYGSLQFVSERDVLCNEQRKHLLHANLFFSFKFYKQICSLRLKFKLRLLRRNLQKPVASSAYSNMQTSNKTLKENEIITQNNNHNRQFTMITVSFRATRRIHANLLLKSKSDRSDAP